MIIQAQFNLFPINGRVIQTGGQEYKYINIQLIIFGRDQQNLVHGRGKLVQLVRRLGRLVQLV